MKGQISQKGLLSRFIDLCRPDYINGLIFVKLSLMFLIVKFNILIITKRIDVLLITSIRFYLNILFYDKKLGHKERNTISECDF